MNNVLREEALEFVGPAFEEMDVNDMMDMDAEVTPATPAISMSVLKVSCSAVTSVAFTFTVDKIFNHK